MSKRHFSKVGRVTEPSSEGCQVLMDGQAVITIPSQDLLLISVRNIPNLRLVNQRITDATATLSDVDGLRHAIMGYLGGGSVVSRAFADYILKAPLPILEQCLSALHTTQADIPHAIAQVLGLTFQLVSSDT